MDNKIERVHGILEQIQGVVADLIMTGEGELLEVVDNEVSVPNIEQPSIRDEILQMVRGKLNEVNLTSNSNNLPKGKTYKEAINRGN